MTTSAENSPTDVLDDVFGDHVLIVTPWARATRRKGVALYDRDVVGEFVAQPPQLTEVDPASLVATQTWVVREHVRYYLTGEWERTGRTSADMHQRASRYPLISPDDRGQLLILAGHHRAMAARIEGRMLQTRVVGQAVEGLVAVTPSIWADSPCHLLVDRLVASGLTSDEVTERLRFTRLQLVANGTLCR